MPQTPEEISAQNVEITRIGRAGYLHSIIPIVDSSGEIIQRIVKPLMVELKLKDVIQIFVGASLLAIPMAYTEETWQLGESLPLLNIGILALLSLIFIAIFVYANFYRYYLKGFVFEYIKRIIAIYLISLIVVGFLMTVILTVPL